MAGRRAFAIALKRQGCSRYGESTLQERRILGGRAGHSQVDESPSSRGQLKLQGQTGAEADVETVCLSKSLQIRRFG